MTFLHNCLKEASMLNRKRRTQFWQEENRDLWHLSMQPQSTTPSPKQVEHTLASMVNVQWESTLPIARLWNLVELQRPTIQTVTTSVLDTKSQSAQLAQEWMLLANESVTVSTKNLMTTQLYNGNLAVSITEHSSNWSKLMILAKAPDPLLQARLARFSPEETQWAKGDTPHTIRKRLMVARMTKKASSPKIVLKSSTRSKAHTLETRSKRCTLKNRQKLTNRFKMMVSKSETILMKLVMKLLLSERKAKRRYFHLGKLIKIQIIFHTCLIY